MDAVLVMRMIGIGEVDTYPPPTYTCSRLTFDRHYEMIDDQIRVAIRSPRKTGLIPD